MGEAGEPACACEVTIRPAMRGWLGGEVDRSAFSLSERARVFRKELGLRTDVPIVASGHQAQLWHPGILAKWLAMDVAAGRAETGEAGGGQRVWLIVDHDANESASVSYPVVNERGGDVVMERRSWRAFDAELEGRPTRFVPAMEPGELPGEVGEMTGRLAEVRNGLVRAHGALSAHADAPDVAHQFSSAVRELADEWCEGSTTLVYASACARTSLFAELVERMTRDPARCVFAYNRAVRAHAARGGHGIGELAVSEANSLYELPLWRMDARAKTRRAVLWEELDGVEASELAPKALLTTGLMRLAGCEVFIAGTGGAGEHGYERVADEWLRTWLGEKGGELAPVVLATATLRLDLGAGPISDEDVQRAVWAAHHARHELSMLGQHDAQARKRELAEGIAQAPRHSTERRQLFRQMQMLMREARAAGRDRLEAHEQAAERAKRRLAMREVVEDRAWPFVLYDRAQLAGLRAAIERAYDEDMG